MPGSVSLCLYFQPETDERLAHDLLVRGFEVGQSAAAFAGMGFTSTNIASMTGSILS